MGDRLRALWRFDDLDASEGRLRAQLEQEASEPGRAEVLTQLARVHGLRGDFAAGERMLEEAEALAGTSRVAQARIDLERGRLRRSSGDPQAALPLFESAFRSALAAGEPFIAVDAAHMAALAAPDDGAFHEWTRRGIELAEEGGPSVRYWLGPLLNNLGWRHFEAGEHEQALDAFEGALGERERDPGNGEADALARYAVAKALRALGRPQEALDQLAQAIAWTDAEERPDGWYHEELALTYAALGRGKEAGTQAALALQLLGRDDPAFADDDARTGALRELADA